MSMYPPPGPLPLLALLVNSPILSNFIIITLIYLWFCKLVPVVRSLFVLELCIHLFIHLFIYLFPFHSGVLLCRLVFVFFFPDFVCLFVFDIIYQFY